MSLTGTPGSHANGTGYACLLSDSVHDWDTPMTDENYGKCDVCRYCAHSGDAWECTLHGKRVEPKGSCGAYRPGCCENCGFCRIEDGNGFCERTGEEVFVLGVCDFYDPSGRITQ